MYRSGWYPDPHRPGLQRWYDGTTWTDHWVASAGSAVGIGGRPTTIFEPVPATRYVTVVPAGPNGILVVLAWIAAMVSFLYMLPWAVSVTTNSRHQLAVFVINLLLGWTLIGWVMALVLSFTGPRAVVIPQHPGPIRPARVPPTAPVPGAAPPVGF